MNFDKRAARACALLLCLAAASAWPSTRTGSAQAPAYMLMEAGELKARLDANRPVTIIDVRATDSYIGSDAKIKGALHVRLRRLRARLGVSPLKDVPRDREVVAYCACAGDEASVHAAQTLLEAGFKRVYVLKGGWQAWLAVRGPVEAKPQSSRQ